MTMTEKEVGSITVLALAGKLTSNDTGVLKDKVSSLIGAGKPDIVLNLAELSYMDSSGLGQMVSCHTSARGKGAVKLANLANRIQDLLIMTKLHLVFDVYESEAEALASFEPSA